MDRPTETAALLLTAWADPSQKLSGLPPALIPTNAAEAYAVQQQVSAGLGAIGGWKVGTVGCQLLFAGFGAGIEKRVVVDAGQHGFA